MMMRCIPSYYFLLATASFIHGCFPWEMRTWMARADLHADSSLLPTGTLIFTQPEIPGSPVRVTGRLINLMPNTRYHGFHVHVFALPAGEWNCSKAGDHWNPYGTLHGGRFDSIEHRHVGDLGNIWSDQFGSATIDFEDFIIQLSTRSVSSILDRSIVIHKDVDDFGRGLFSDSKITGHAGSRIACGNIRISDRGQSVQPIPWGPFLPRSCECLTTSGQCTSYGSYQCSPNQRASIVQCIGKNRWAPSSNCPSSCVRLSDGQPYCF